MSYCPKCGRQILDENLGCPVCNLKENATNTGTTTEEKAEVIKEFTVEDANGTSQRFETEHEANEQEERGSQGPRPIKEQTIPTVLKVVVILAIVIAGGVGQVAGLIAGVVLLKSPVEDYSRFGKTLVVISCVMLGIWLLCCVVSGLFGVAGNMMYAFY